MTSRMKSGLAGAVFEVYAAEDIYTADFQIDDNGNRIFSMLQRMHWWNRYNG